jgi:hypothetical protein
MSALIIAFILVGSLIAICFILIMLHNKHKRQATNDLLKFFSQAGTENKLSFSGQEVLTNGVLGLDGIQRQVLFVARENTGYSTTIIDMNEVKNCSVKKVYGAIETNGLKNNQPEHYLERIVLNFDIEERPSVEIAFFRHFENHIYETLELEQKAKHWESVLSKMKPSLKTVSGNGDAQKFGL